MLELKHACKLFTSPTGPIQAVDDVSVTVGRGETLMIFGPSGSGKTTLLLLAAGLLQADAGHVRFEGRELAALAKHELLSYRRTNLGFVSQSFNLVAGLTAAENVAMPLLIRGENHHEAQDRAFAALDRVGLLSRSAHTAAKLSGGEQQRVAIARALVGEPKLVLADEPTGNLDTESGNNALRLLKECAREHGASTILVTHDLRISPYADRVVEMRDGALNNPALQLPNAAGG